MPRATSLAPLEKTRGFGMTPLYPTRSVSIRTDRQSKKKNPPFDPKRGLTTLLKIEPKV